MKHILNKLTLKCLPNLNIIRLILLVPCSIDLHAWTRSMHRHSGFYLKPISRCKLVDVTSNRVFNTFSPYERTQLYNAVDWASHTVLCLHYSMFCIQAHIRDAHLSFFYSFQKCRDIKLSCSHNLLSSLAFTYVFGCLYLTLPAPSASKNFVIVHLKWVPPLSISCTLYMLSRCLNGCAAFRSTDMYIFIIHNVTSQFTNERLRNICKMDSCGKHQSDICQCGKLISFYCINLGSLVFFGLVFCGLS